MGLAYPAGPRIETLANQGDKDFIEFPKAMGNRKDKRFSFSGLKTSLRYKLDKLSEQKLKSIYLRFVLSYKKQYFISSRKKQLSSLKKLSASIRA